MENGPGSGLGRRIIVRHCFAAVAAAALGACGAGEGPPGADVVRDVVKARLEALRTRFLDGDEAAVPPDVAERLAGADMQRLRESVRKAEVNSFSSGAFEKTPEGNWKGRVNFEALIPSPISALSLRYLVSADAILRITGSRWSFVAFGPMEIRRAADAGRA